MLFTNILPEAICCCLETCNVYVVLLTSFCISDDWLAVVAISDWLVAVADWRGVVDSLGGSSCHSMSLSPLSSSELSTVLIIIDGYVYLFTMFSLTRTNFIVI